ncbi:formate dehydrogenase subunit gamma [Paracandidimonas soli]|uniref:Formate dehydrogenase subunit gamma n=2 Tax=Paracandidimonas soli TaxID=1917182 RepID=A0A4R3VCD1_9BURK|nr:formate dehydrogenase subunit gamma [Paracandidimonas soli]TCV02976.1 formate dehydrogenase subunit gamma [Paracandidimonas soli]
MASKSVYSAKGDKIVSTKPLEISRYRAFTRANHWFTAICTILLMLSGFAFFHPSLYGLTSLFGGGEIARWLHPILGVVLFVSFLLMFIQMWRLNVVRREDIEWMSKSVDVIRQNEEKLPELGKYNAGQKIMFWAMTWLILILIVTGVIMWEEFFAGFFSIPARRIALALHALAALAMLLVFVIHVYAAIWTRGTIRAMTRGTVTGGWAYRHHRKWLRELAGRRSQGSAK